MKRKSVWLLYRGDAWLSTASMELLGIYEEQKKAICAGVKDCIKQKCNVNQWMNDYSDMVYSYGKRVAKAKMKEIVAEQLHENLQTQTFDINYMLEVHEVL